MRLRAPSYPLITSDPFFSVWSPADKLTDATAEHWTARPNTILGTAEIDGTAYRFMGTGSLPAMKQISVDCNAFSTTYVFEQSGIRLTLVFTSPLIPNDLYLISRPVSYLEIKKEITDRKKHTVSIKIAVSEEICTNRTKSEEVSAEPVTCEAFSSSKLSSIKMGTVAQNILPCAGDDQRISWGYFYLTGEGRVEAEQSADGLTFAAIQVSPKPSSLITFAYDDIYSLEYFHQNVKAYWCANGAVITDEIAKAHKDYKLTLRKCNDFSDKMFADAVRAGGEKYAELLELSLRQTIAGHKLAVDADGKIIFISKECFSNGCAATVDITYPSSPLFLIYNPELLKGMMRPIYKYASSEEWQFDFAPHDAGRYPLLNGQVYGSNRLEKQMPIEECGNMLILEAAIALSTKSTAFADEHLDILEAWVKYLINNGRDPENQLCTDDFAGHMAHNCNLSLKAIMGIAGLGIIYGMKNNKKSEKKYMRLAKEMAEDWAKRASKGDGSYKLAFDAPNTFSMKYNIVWDKLFGTDIMAKEVLQSEFASYKQHIRAYGMPLDNRASYTKSDWLVWTATLSNNRDEFEGFVAPMWTFYNTSPSRVPMTDWYYTVSGEHKTYFSNSEQTEKSFRNRTVQGGLFIKLLEYKGIIKYK